MKTTSNGFFPLPPKLAMLEDGRHFLLLEDFHYLSLNKKLYTARAGLRSDGGSIPPVFWSVIGSPWTGKRRYAYIIHDQLCLDCRQALAEGVDKKIVAEKRLEADRLLHEMCRRLGTPPPIAAIIYAAVRLSALLLIK